MPTDPVKAKEIINSPEWPLWTIEQKYQALAPYSDWLASIKDPTERAMQLGKWENKHRTAPTVQVAPATRQALDYLQSRNAVSTASSVPTAPSQNSFWSDFASGVHQGMAQGPLRVVENLANALGGPTKPAAKAVRDFRNWENAAPQPADPGIINKFGRQLPEALAMTMPWFGGPAAGIGIGAGYQGIKYLDEGLPSAIGAELLTGVLGNLDRIGLRALSVFRGPKGSIGSNLKKAYTPTETIKAFKGVASAPAVPVVPQVDPMRLAHDVIRLEPEAQAAKLSAFEELLAKVGKPSAAPIEARPLTQEHMRLARELVGLHTLGKKLETTLGADSPVTRAVKGYQLFNEALVDPAKANGYTAIEQKASTLYAEAVRKHGLGSEIPKAAWDMLDPEYQSTLANKYLQKIIGKIMGTAEEAAPGL